jgi:hypothetical protein
VLHGLQPPTATTRFSHGQKQVQGQQPTAAVMRAVAELVAGLIAAAPVWKDPGLRISDLDGLPLLPVLQRPQEAGEQLSAEAGAGSGGARQWDAGRLVYVAHRAAVVALPPEFWADPPAPSSPPDLELAETGESALVDEGGMLIAELSFSMGRARRTGGGNSGQRAHPLTQFKPHPPTLDELVCELVCELAGV